MIGGIVYEEKIFSKVMAFIFGATILFMLALLFYFLSLPDEDNGIVVLIYLIIILILLFVGINFSILIIRITPDNLLISFGLFKKRIAWGDIKKCEIVNMSWTKFGGIGIRYTKLQGKTVLAYIVEGATKIALEMKGKKPQMFVFSTKNPNEILNIIRQKVELYRE